MTKEHKRKMVFLLLFVCALVFYARTVPQVSLTERAIVIALGIDYADGQYTISTQIIKPSPSSQGTASDDGYGIMQGTGGTVSAALSQIGIKTGLMLSLSQCNIIILSDNVFRQDMFHSVNYLVQSYQLPETAFMVSTDKTAVDLMRASPLMTNISAFQMQQTLTAYNEDDSVMNTVVKDYMADILSDSGVVTLAYITAQKLAADNSGGGAQSDASKQEYYEFDYNKTLLVSSKLKTLVLDKPHTEAINLVMVKLKKGTLDVTADGTRYSLELDSNKYKADISYENGRIKYGGKLKINCTVEEASDAPKEFAATEISKETLQKISAAAKEKVEKMIKDTFETSRQNGFDVFEIYDKTYSKEGVKFKASVPENYLDVIDFTISAEIKVIKQ